MSSEGAKREFREDELYENLIALRKTAPAVFSGLGKVTLVLLKEYEAARQRAFEQETPVERRESKRIRLYLPAYWEGRSGVYEATIADLSMSGCFLLTSGETVPGESVRLLILAEPERWINIAGEVKNSYPEIGFGARFTGLARREEMLIRRLFSSGEL